MALQTPVALEGFSALQQDTIIYFHNGCSTSKNVSNMTSEQEIGQRGPCPSKIISRNLSDPESNSLVVR